jgi:transcriptional regulator with XRE-family HTH domain
MPRHPVGDDHPFERALGERLRSARTRAGLSRAEVARRVELTAAEYARLERGEALPGLPTLRRLCRVLSLESDELLGLEAPSPELRRLVHAVRGLSAAQLRMLHLLAESLPGASRD